MNVLPPPPPPEYLYDSANNGFQPVVKQRGYGMKCFLLFLQCCLLMLGALAVLLLTYSREDSQNRVSEEIVSQWGGPVSIIGPEFFSPGTGPDFYSAQTYNCNVDVKTKSLHRNMYEAEVYTAVVKIRATFDKSRLPATDTLGFHLIVPANQIDSLSPLKIGSETIEWVRKGEQLCAEIDFNSLPRKFDLTTDFEIRGTEKLTVNYGGENTTITINGEATNPSFTGTFLPLERSIDGDKFSALWTGSNHTKEGRCRGYGYVIPSVGVDFLVGVSHYRKVTRALKYAFFFIFLTYLSVLMTEMLLKRTIPLLNYFLIGAALVIFYILLLSFSGHISFGISFIIASAMTIGLITLYVWKMLSSRRAAIVNGLILIAEYVGCYVMISLSAYALLFGSLMLFIVLAVMMWVSMRINVSSTPPG